MISKEFCESTSLHGYSYLYNSHSIASKIVWTITILTSICLGTFLLAIQTKQFLDKEIITTVETSSLPLRVRNLHNHFNLYICPSFRQGRVPTFEFLIPVTPHLKWKKLLNNSSWDFEHVLDTMDNYWVGPDKNFYHQSTPTRWSCNHFSKKWSKSKFDAKIFLKCTILKIWIFCLL